MKLLGILLFYQARPQTGLYLWFCLPAGAAVEEEEEEEEDVLQRGTLLADKEEATQAKLR